MTIKQLIKELQKTDGKGTVFVETTNDNGEIILTKKVGVSFDDNNDVSIYPAA